MTFAARSDDEAGELAGWLGRYRLLGTLGQGGMGTIHVALSSGVGVFKKLVVLKELRRELTRNERFVEMFLAEAKVAAKLNHPNVIHTLEAGIEGDRHFLAMEFLDGQPFSNVLRRSTHDRRFPLAMRLRVVADALAGLHYAHTLCDYDGRALEIVHRDVSPQNVFVTYDGQVKVLDFGIAKAAGEEASTNPGVFKGKFGYAAPEQVMGQPSDLRADLFSAGVMLWEVIAGRRFAPGKPTRAAVDLRMAGAEPRLRDVAPDAHPALAEICDRAMAVNPADRFATADEMRAALHGFLVASGDDPDSRALGVALRELFAEDRSAMHRVIDAGLKEDERSHSMIQALSPGLRQAEGNEEPTTVAHLSQLIQSIRAEHGGEPPPAEVARLRPARRGYLLAIAAVLGVGLGIFFEMNRSEVSPRGAPGGGRPAPAATQTAPRDPNPASAEATPAASVAPVASPLENAAPVSAPTQGVRAGRGAPSLPVRGTARRASPRAAPEPEAAPPPRASTATQTPDVPRASAANSGAPVEGDDIRRLKPRSERKLDMEDPFQ